MIESNEPTLMSPDKKQFLVDERGKKTAVLLPIEMYTELVEAQEELDSLRAYTEAKCSGDDVIPFARAVAEIECD
jgi:hypothetical protein